VIRLGSLGGYPFEGPRILAGWSPPAAPGVFAILYVPDRARPDRHAVIYVGQAEDLAQAGFPFQHPASPCWVKRAGSRYDLHVAWYDAPGNTARHREQVVKELCAVYRPGCNEQQFEHAWKDEWIGWADPAVHTNLTSPRDPNR
jgi:hypothetical protein